MWFFFSKQVYLRPGHPLLKVWAMTWWCFKMFMAVVLVLAGIQMMLGH